MSSLNTVGSSEVMEKLWERSGERLESYEDAGGCVRGVLGYTRHDNLYDEMRPEHMQQRQQQGSSSTVANTSSTIVREVMDRQSILSIDGISSRNKNTKEVFDLTQDDSNDVEVELHVERRDKQLHDEVDVEWMDDDHIRDTHSSVHDAGNNSHSDIVNDDEEEEVDDNSNVPNNNDSNIPNNNDDENHDVKDVDRYDDDDEDDMVRPKRSNRRRIILDEEEETEDVEVEHNKDVNSITINESINEDVSHLKEEFDDKINIEYESEDEDEVIANTTLEGSIGTSRESSGVRVDTSDMKIRRVSVDTEVADNSFLTKSVLDEDESMKEEDQIILMKGLFRRRVVLDDEDQDHESYNYHNDNNDSSNTIRIDEDNGSYREKDSVYADDISIKASRDNMEASRGISTGVNRREDLGCNQFLNEFITPLYEEQGYVDVESEASTYNDYIAAQMDDISNVGNNSIVDQSSAQDQLDLLSKYVNSTPPMSDGQHWDGSATPGAENNKNGFDVAVAIGGESNVIGAERGEIILCGFCDSLVDTSQVTIHFNSNNTLPYSITPYGQNALVGESKRIGSDDDMLEVVTDGTEHSSEVIKMLEQNLEYSIKSNCSNLDDNKDDLTSKLTTNEEIVPTTTVEYLKPISNDNVYSVRDDLDITTCVDGNDNQKYVQNNSAGAKGDVIDPLQDDILTQSRGNDIEFDFSLSLSGRHSGDWSDIENYEIQDPNTSILSSSDNNSNDENTSIISSSVDDSDEHEEEEWNEEVSTPKNTPKNIKFRKEFDESEQNKENEGCPNIFLKKNKINNNIHNNMKGVERTPLKHKPAEANIIDLSQTPSPLNVVHQDDMMVTKKKRNAKNTINEFSDGKKFPGKIFRPKVSITVEAFDKYKSTMMEAREAEMNDNLENALILYMAALDICDEEEITHRKLWDLGHQLNYFSNK